MTRAAAEESEDPGAFQVILYVAGVTPASSRAVSNLVQLCNDRLGDRYELEVVDLYQHPERAAQDDVIVAPTVIRKRPAPPQALFGDLSDPERVVIALGLHEH